MQGRIRVETGIAPDRPTLSFRLPETTRASAAPASASAAS